MRCSVWIDRELSDVLDFVAKSGMKLECVFKVASRACCILLVQRLVQPAR